MLAAEAFSELVGSIYDCALDPARWPATLRRIRRELGFHNAVLGLMEIPSGRQLLAVTDGIEEPWLSRMKSFGAAVIAHWGGSGQVISFPLEEPLVLSEVNPHVLSGADPYVVEWARPQGLIDVMAVGLVREPSALANLAFGRHERDGPITSQEVVAARMLAPHLQRAVAISRLLDVQRLTAETLSEVVDALDVSVLSVDQAGQPLFLNREARQLLESNDLIQLRSGAITLPNAIADGALRAALSRTASRPVGRPEAITVTAQGRSGREYVLHALSIPEAGQIGRGSRGRSALFIAPVDRSEPAVGLAAMAELYGLTATERRVLALAADGANAVEIAKTLQVRVSTAKTHLLALFEKTAVRRQAELVALAARFRLPVRTVVTP